MKFKNCQFFKKGIFWLMSCRCEKNWICGNRNSAISPVQTHIQHFKIQMNCSEFFFSFLFFSIWSKKGVLFIVTIFIVTSWCFFTISLCNRKISVYKVNVTFSITKNCNERDILLYTMDLVIGNLHYYFDIWL